MIETDSLLEKSFTSSLKVFASFFNATPAFQHIVDVMFNFLDSIQQQIADAELISEASEVSAILSFLTMCDRTVNQGKPVKELLRSLDGMGWV
jgi:hypothetical protein